MTAFSDETGMKLGRFNHHPDPAIDFCIEVEVIEAEWLNIRHGFTNGTPPQSEIVERLAKAMQFRVGGDPQAVAAKDILRRIEKEAAALSASPVAQEPVAWLMIGEKASKDYPGTNLTIYPQVVTLWRSAGAEVVPLFRSPPATPAGVTHDDPLDDLVARFSAALLAKLKAARVKYGYDEGWREPGWESDCQRHLLAHLAKGDPRDVAAYCAFMWHHGWITTPPATPAGLGADEIARLQRCLNTLRPFTSRLIGGEGSPARLEQQDRAKAFEEANAILALLSRAGDQK